MRLENLLLEMAIRSIDTLLKRGQERSDKTIVMSVAVSSRQRRNRELSDVFTAVHNRMLPGEFELRFVATAGPAPDRAAYTSAFQAAIRFVEIYRDYGFVYVQPLPGVDAFASSMLDELRLEMETFQWP